MKYFKVLAVSGAIIATGFAKEDGQGVTVWNGAPDAAPSDFDDAEQALKALGGGAVVELLNDQEYEAAKAERAQAFSEPKDSHAKEEDAGASSDAGAAQPAEESVDESKAA